jgi:ubiquinone/menaquinone biosynthesis C-methylase UbiE
MKEKQKAIFIKTEGDAWYERNRYILAERSYEHDPIIRAIDSCLGSQVKLERGRRLLEIGCGEGYRLRWLEDHRGFTCSGIEPSEKAVNAACKDGLEVKRGTADLLPYGNGEFDFLVFGFCLYLCDQDDLFMIAQEANRVLSQNGWLIIHDFYSNIPRSVKYAHHEGVSSNKMDYRKLFEWHPAYTCYSHELNHHQHLGFTDNSDEWVGTSILRKKS